MGQKFSINQHSISSYLTWIKDGDIAIPEIQRPFVWSSSKVRDLIDSLYNGFPIGYLIIWRNPDIKLKSGGVSLGRRILIDGQQRITALKAAVLGHEVVDEDYRKKKVVIAFQPIEEKFEVSNPAIEKDAKWLPDIAEIIGGELSSLNQMAARYAEANDVDIDLVYRRLDSLGKITATQIGLIELDSNLDIETVTDIFVRINSQGVALSQADFVMSKIAANETYGGTTIRKAIDYFSHLSHAPEFFNTIREYDKDFASTSFFRRMSWLKDEKDDLYDPGYTDVIRVAFTSEFGRGKLSDLVSLLSGRNFDTRTYEEEIAEHTFLKLAEGVEKFINEINFKKLLMILNSAGFIHSSLVRSMNAVNFAYIAYLKLRALGVDSNLIERFVRRWYVMSVLTGRYSGSPESQFDADIKQISLDSQSYLDVVERSELSDAFWQAGLVDRLRTSASSNPYFRVFIASQVKAGDKGFLSKEISVKDLVTHYGDIHHIFPRAYLKDEGLSQTLYNQAANYVYMQSEINIKIGKRPPKDYFSILRAQANGGALVYGSINSMGDLEENLRSHCVPLDVFDMDVDNYTDFLATRRLLMAEKLRNYYFAL